MKLIPTPRTDKNGRTTIRHMKPEKHTAGTKLIPVVQMPSSQTPEPGLSNERVMELIANSRGIFAGMHLDISSLDAIRVYNPDSFARASAYLDNGSPKARSMAVTALCKSVNNFLSAFSSEYQSVSSTAHSYLDTMESEVVMSWAVGEVIDETGRTEDHNRVVGAAVILESMLNSHRNGVSRSVDPEYCRTIAVLTLACQGQERLDSERIEFLQWVTGRDDLRLVIETARERGTVNVGVLSEVLDRGITPPLREGTL